MLFKTFIHLMFNMFIAETMLSVSNLYVSSCEYLSHCMDEVFLTFRLYQNKDHSMQS